MKKTKLTIGEYIIAKIIELILFIGLMGIYSIFFIDVIKKLCE